MAIELESGGNVLLEDKKTVLRGEVPEIGFDDLRTEQGGRILLEDGVTGLRLEKLPALAITDTRNFLLLPINCVVAGQQKEPIKMAMGLNGAITGPMRGIFGE